MIARSVSTWFGLRSGNRHFAARRAQLGFGQAERLGICHPGPLRREGRRFQRRALVALAARVSLVLRLRLEMVL